MFIDLNADLAEGAGADADLLRVITSANVCCGGHAGGPDAIRDTVAAAVERGVTVGAHPGYADRVNFGRIELGLSPAAIAAECLRQIRELLAVAPVKYVKPHGAMYHRVCGDPAAADAFAEVATGLGLPVVGLPGSALADACIARGVRFVPEGFADRRYRPDGTLVPRSDPAAVIESPAAAVEQVRELISGRGVETVCVHGDTPGAAAFAAAVRDSLIAAGFTIRAFA